MLLNSYRLIFVTIGLIGVLLLASPIIALFVQPPPVQEFSEIYILGPTHTLGNFPFNIKSGVSYFLYLGVNNNLGHTGYYSCLFKIVNDSQLIPNQVLGAPSSVTALYEYKLFLDDGATWETPLIFKVNTLNLAGNSSQISSININGIDYPVNITSNWNSSKTGFYYNIVVELWLFSPANGISQYDNRFVSLILNMTQ